MPIERFNLILDHTKNLSPKILHLAFRREDQQPFCFIPGQFITFLLNTPDNQIKRRSYSISSIPALSSTDKLEIAVSYVPNGIASEILFNLKPGEKLSAMGPAGKLIIDPKDFPNTKRYLLIGTGTGIAPYRAMLNALADRIHHHPEFKILMLFGAQYRQDLLYLDDFLAFQKKYPDHFSLRAQLSREDFSTTPRASYEYTGYVQTALSDPALKLNPKEDLVFLCGNPNMIDQTFEILSGLSFESQKIRREKYISSN